MNQYCILTPSGDIVNIFSIVYITSVYKQNSNTEITFTAYFSTSLSVDFRYFLYRYDQNIDELYIAVKKIHADIGCIMNNYKKVIEIDYPLNKKNDNI